VVFLLFSKQRVLLAGCGGSRRDVALRHSRRVRNGMGPISQDLARHF
jgi:hypothetical protein